MTLHSKQIELSPEASALVDQVLGTGVYASANDVVEDALRQWNERRDLGGYSADEIRRLWDEGIASGPGGDGRALLAELRAKYTSPTGE